MGIICSLKLLFVFQKQKYCFFPSPFFLGLIKEEVRSNSEEKMREDKRKNIFQLKEQKGREKGVRKREER